MKNPLLAAAFITIGLLLGGCGGETPSSDTAAPEQSEGHDDHGHDDHHDHDDGHEEPETFAAAVAELSEMRDTVKAAFADDDLKKADGPVHEVGHVLEGLVSLAEKAGLSDEQQATVKTAQESLFAAFAALDETIHGKESGKSWDDVGTDVDQAIASLQELAPSSEPEGTEQ